MKLIRNKHLALIRGDGASFWRVEWSADDAVKGVCREFCQAFPTAQERLFDAVYVYLIPPGRYAHWNDNGTFLVNELTDTIVAAAQCAFVYKNVSSKRPMTTCRLDPEEAKRISERAAEATHLEMPPIGQRIPA